MSMLRRLGAGGFFRLSISDRLQAIIYKGPSIEDYL